VEPSSARRAASVAVASARREAIARGRRVALLGEGVVAGDERGELGPRRGDSDARRVALLGEGVVARRELGELTGHARP
jgi:hypothetical protein